MNLAEILGLVAGLLQFCVAMSALRLNRLFGTARVGWSLFSAFLLLALVHLIQSAPSIQALAPVGNEADVIYALTSLLLLTSMIHLETVIKGRNRLEQEQQRMNVSLEAEVKKKTAYLLRAIEELETEMNERKRMEVEVETTRWELREVSSRIEMAHMATEVLEKLAAVIRSVNVTAGLVSNQVKRSKIANVVRVGALIRQHQGDLAKFMADDPRGQKLPVYMAQLAEHLAAEQSELLKELDSIKTDLEKVVVMQQDYARRSGVAMVSDVPVLTQGTLAQIAGRLPTTSANGIGEEVGKVGHEYIG